jgi:drug/metabolite transporter (DMT)-like permease
MECGTTRQIVIRSHLNRQTLTRNNTLSVRPDTGGRRKGKRSEEGILLDARNEGLYPLAMASGSSGFGYGAVIVAAILWGGSIVAQKLALSGFSPVEASVLRDSGGLAILLATWWWQEGELGRLTTRDYTILGLLGLGVLGNHLLILIGLKYVSGAVAGVIIGSLPVVTALLSALFIQDVPLRSVWASSLLSFLGVAFVSVAGFKSAGEQPLLGGVLVFLGVASWAVYSVGSRTIMERLSALTVNWTTLLVATILQVPLLWTDQKMMRGGISSVSLSDWLALGYLVVFATAVAQQAWLYGVKGIGPSRASVLGNLTPVAAIVLSALVLKESVGMIEVVGIVLILGGVWVLHIQTSKPSHS